MLARGAAARVARPALAARLAAAGGAPRSLAAAAAARVVRPEDPHNNVTEAIAAKMGRELHNVKNHPIEILKRRIYAHFGPEFQTFDQLDPVVSTQACFDDLLVAPDHVSRRPSDTYYVSQDAVLRAHTSAHQSALLGAGHDAFLVSADVYRRDEIDSCHYPVFHQMEGVRAFSEQEIPAELPRAEAVARARDHLTGTLEALVDDVFGPVEKRWVDAYFPFTDPSLELEIFFEGDWLEVLGCGVVEQQIMRNAGRGEQLGWAFGLGLERLAMVLFQIPDIRLFWSEDERFLSQFAAGEIVPFQPYSNYSPVYKDVSFWVDAARPFHENDLMELVRGVAGDVAEQVALVDEFTHPKTGRASQCYRVTYRHMDRNLTHEEINLLQDGVRSSLVEELGVELR